MEIDYLNSITLLLEDNCHKLKSHDSKNKLNTFNKFIKFNGITSENFASKFSNFDSLKSSFLENYSDSSKGPIKSRLVFLDNLFYTIKSEFITGANIPFANLIIILGKIKYGENTKLETIANKITAEMSISIGKKTLVKWIRGIMSIGNTDLNIRRLNNIEEILIMNKNELVTAAGISNSYVKVINRKKNKKSKLIGIDWETLAASFRNEFEEFVKFKTKAQNCKLKRNLPIKEQSSHLMGENTWSLRDDLSNGSAMVFKSQIAVFLGFLVNHNNISLSSINNLIDILDWNNLRDYHDFRLETKSGFNATARFFSTLTSNCYKNGFFHKLANSSMFDKWENREEFESWLDYVETLRESLLKSGSEALDALHNDNTEEKAALINIKHMLPSPANKLTYKDTISTCNGIIDCMEKRATSLVAPKFKVIRKRSIVFLRIALYRPLRVMNFCKLKIIDEADLHKNSGSVIFFNSCFKLWQIKIPKNAFKNRQSKSCKSLDCTLSEILSSHIPPVSG
jgi:DNA-binding Xre family transcriptional regulator